MHNIIVFFMKLMARALGSRFYENFHMTDTLATLYDEGMLARASGFVFEYENEAIGIYILRYENNIKDNIGGRWN